MVDAVFGIFFSAFAQRLFFCNTVFGERNIHVADRCVFFFKIVDLVLFLCDFFFFSGNVRRVRTAYFCVSGFVDAESTKSSRKENRDHRDPNDRL